MPGEIAIALLGIVFEFHEYMNYTIIGKRWDRSFGGGPITASMGRNCGRILPAWLSGQASRSSAKSPCIVPFKTERLSKGANTGVSHLIRPWLTCTPIGDPIQLRLRSSTYLGDMLEWLYENRSIRRCKTMAAITTISSKYQIVIPRPVREQFRLKPGQKVMFIPYQKSIRLVIVPLIEEARGMFQSINTDDLREEEDEER